MKIKERARADLGGRSAKPIEPEKDENLRHNPGTGIKNHVVKSARARRQIALMPFIEAGYDRGSKHSGGRPTWSPFRPVLRRQRFAPRTKQKDAQQSVTEDVSALAHEEVEVFKARVGNAEKIMQYRIQKSTGIMRREPGGRFDRNDDEPQDRGNPGFQDFVAVLAQSCIEKVGSAGDSPAVAGATRPRPKTLFNRIIRRFASDHYVVNVALAQSGAADTDETRLL